MPTFFRDSLFRSFFKTFFFQNILKYIYVVFLLKSFISPLLTLGYQRPLEEDDLYSNIPSEESEYLTDNLEK